MARDVDRRTKPAKKNLWTAVLICGFLLTLVTNPAVAADSSCSEAGEQLEICYDQCETAEPELYEDCRRECRLYLAGEHPYCDHVIWPLPDWWYPLP